MFETFDIIHDLRLERGTYLQTEDNTTSITVLKILNATDLLATCIQIILFLVIIESYTYVKDKLSKVVLLR